MLPSYKLKWSVAEKTGKHSALLCTDRRVFQELSNEKERDTTFSRFGCLGRML